MWTFIRDYGQHYREFVDVIDDGFSRRFVLRPFDGQSVQDITHDGERLFCLSESVFRSEYNDHLSELAVFDLATGDELQRKTLPFQAQKVTHLSQNGLLAVQFLERYLHFLDESSLEVLWETQPMYAPVLGKRWHFVGPTEAKSYTLIPSEERPISPFRPTPPGFVQVGAQVFEDVDGNVRGLASSEYGDREAHSLLGLSFGAFSFDIAKRRHAFHPIEFSPWGAHSENLFAPSPDGRFALRLSPRRSFGPLHDAGHDPTRYVWLIEHQMLDLWSLADQRPVRSLSVSDMPVSCFLAGSDPEAAEQILRRLADWSCSGDDAFRLPSSYPPGVKKPNLGINALRALRNLHTNQRMTSVTWEPDSLAFWVERRGSLRRIPVDGNRGPLLFFERYMNDENRTMLARRPPGVDIGVGEAYPIMHLPYINTISTTETHIRLDVHSEVISIPKDLATSDAPMIVLTDDMIETRSFPALRAKDIALMAPGLVRLKSWKQPDIAAGLEHLAAKLRDEFSNLCPKPGVLSLIFQVGASLMDEKAFIDKLAEKEIDVVNAAKSVIDAWGKALRQNEVTFGGADDDGAAPLGHVLAYLAERDDDCSEQLRVYCLLRDGEHESFSRDVVLKGHIERLGLKRPDLWRLAILRALLFDRDGGAVGKDGQPVSDWVHTGILQTARTELDPREFAGMVQEELALFISQPDVFAAFGTHADAAAKARQDLFKQLGETQWDRAVTAALS